MNNKHAAPFFLIAGPCVVESEEVMHNIARHISSLCAALGIEYIFKASYKKANRTRIDSFTGIGMQEGLSLIREIGQKYGVRTITDIHNAQEAWVAAEYVDILQIPAFLSRQTDLLVAAAKTGKTINIKKGQFLSGSAMRFAMEKVIASGGKEVWLTERGNSFGYTDLVVDFRNIPIMQALNAPVIMDATHAVQQPNQGSGITGGTPAHIVALACAAVAVGVNGIFLETHPQPEQAKSDGANALPLADMEGLLRRLLAIGRAVAESK